MDVSFIYVAILAVVFMMNGAHHPWRPEAYSCSWPGLEEIDVDFGSDGLGPWLALEASR